MRPLRIAQVCPYDLDRPGGVQAHVRGLASELARRGHAVTIVAPRPPEHEYRGEVHGAGCQQAPRALEGSVTVLRLGRARTVRLSSTQIDVVAASVAELTTLGSLGLDIVHLHTPHNPWLPLQVRWYTPQATHVATFHDAPPGGIWGSFARAWLLPLAGWVMVRGLLKSAVAVSEVAAAATGAWLEPGELPVAPNGIDTSTFGPPCPAQPACVVYVGRLEPRKGVDDLLEAFVRLRAHDARLVVAGEGPLGDTLRRRYASHPNIHFAGRVSEADKARLLATCTLFCSPARHGESFGIVLLEAMASGAPVVAAANPGYRALAGGYAVLYPPGSVAHLADRLEQVLGDAALRQQLSQRGLALAQRYDWSRVVDRIESLYVEALGHRGQARPR
jgi:phosphatidyl-myo-inositol alpha-mannosyltransferase